VAIACSLSTAEAPGRVEEWGRVVDDFVAETVRTSAGVRFRLKDGPESRAVVRDLARREKACCAFFDFGFVDHAGSVWLEVGGPDEARMILDQLFRLPTQQGAWPSGHEKSAVTRPPVPGAGVRQIGAVRNG
jgi:hypothetical protein